MNSNKYFDEEEKERIFNSINKASFTYYEQGLIKYYDFLKLSKNSPFLKNFGSQNFQDLMEFTIFISQNWLDISSALLIYLKPNNNYQEIYGLKNLIIHLNEGYKRLIHFKGKGRKDSLLHTLIIKIVENDEILKSELNLIMHKLEEYSAEFQNDDFKNKRSFFVHYEGTPSIVYENSTNINIEELNKNALEFVNILGELIRFITKIINKILN